MVLVTVKEMFRSRGADDSDLSYVVILILHPVMVPVTIVTVTGTIAFSEIAIDFPTNPSSTLCTPVHDLYLLYFVDAVMLDTLRLRVKTNHVIVLVIPGQSPGRDFIGDAAHVHDAGNSEVQVTRLLL